MNSALVGLQQKFDKIDAKLSDRKHEIDLYKEQQDLIEERIIELIRTVNAQQTQINALLNQHPSCQCVVPLKQNMENFRSGERWDEWEEEQLKEAIKGFLQYQNKAHNRTPLALAIKLRDKLIRQICKEL